jgi:hypothetical protein
MPALFTTFAHFAISIFWKPPNSSGLLAVNFAPIGLGNYRVAQTHQYRPNQGGSEALHVTHHAFIHL